MKQPGPLLSFPLELYDYLFNVSLCSTGVYIQAVFLMESLELCSLKLPFHILIINISRLSFLCTYVHNRTRRDYGMKHNQQRI